MSSISRSAPLGRIALALAGALALVGAASAAPTYGNIAAPGVYFGSGNVNGNWTINTSNNVEVALRAKNRGLSGATFDGSSGTYFVPHGACISGALACGGTPGTRAAWNYEFSVNARADGVGSADLVGLNILLEVDTDPTFGFNWVPLNVLTNWSDNSFWNATTATRRVSVGANLADNDPLIGEIGLQQSANPSFGNSGFGFIPGAGSYGLRLSVLRDTALLSQVQTTVQVPEPGSLALAGLALAALGVAARRRRAG
jgi:hypothetical protein